jgi:hypothetical protein
MGCDIHLAVEFKNKKGQWEAPLKLNPYYGEYETDSVFTIDTLDPGRDYYMFGLLNEGVREVRASNVPYSFTPYDYYYKHPEDASQEVIDFVEAWEGDGHSHGSGTLEDLFMFLDEVGADPDFTDIKDMKETIEFTKNFFIKEAATYATGGDLSTVRIIFFFDN